MGVSSLVGLADNDDVCRFERLILDNRSRLLRFLSMVYRSKGRHFIEQVACGAESRAWEKFTSYNPDRGSFVTWLIQLARHVAGELVRVGRYDTEQSLETLAESGTEPSMDGPAVRHEQAELRRTVWQAIRSLPGPERFAFILCDIDGYSLADAARRLKTGVEATRYRLNKARRALRKQLGESRPSSGFGTDWVKRAKGQGSDEAADD